MSDSGEIEILLVEDNPDDVDMTLRALRKANIVNHVKVVRDGAEALAFIFGEGAYAAHHVENVPKLILLDLKLPKVDGFEVFEDIVEDHEGKFQERMGSRRHAGTRWTTN